MDLPTTSENAVRLPSPPLTQRSPKSLIFGALSPSRYALLNDAAAVSAEPFRVQMPEQQWAYGISYPLDHGALQGRPADAPCVLQINLSVEGGTIGVAGCDLAGSTFTTPESFAQGTTQLRITLARPLETAAIVIRQAGTERNVRVTILEIELFDASNEVLAQRGHDLGYDLFVIVSLGKTGTQTIESALRCLSPFVRVHRVHYASAKYSQRLQASAAMAVAMYGPDHEIVRARELQAEAADRARSDIGTVRRLGGRVAFLTAVRDPIGRGISGMFQDLPVAIPVYSDLYALGGPVFAQLLADGLVTAWDHEIKGTLPPSVTDELWFRCLGEAAYFSEEFLSVTGFDLLHHDFDPHIGYARLERGDDVALVFRTSALNQTLSHALAEITGRSPGNHENENVTAHKNCASLYSDVLSRVCVPAPLAETIYSRHPYMRHFFDETEIAELVRRWSGQGVKGAETAIGRRDASA